MSYISIILFAFSANLDNFIVGAAYGLKKIRINITAGVIISFITMFGTILSMTFGERLITFIPITKVNILGAILIIGMGIFYLSNFYFKRWKEKRLAIIREKNNQNSNSGELVENTKDDIVECNSRRIFYREALTIATALSLNNIALGIGASIAGLNLITTAIASFMFSYFFILVGNRFGHGEVSDIIGEYAEPISGTIILLLGILELII
ncbi:MAG: manganese efflux pump [Aminipila sp.]